jgi:hypothetical protein
MIRECSEMVPSLPFHPENTKKDVGICATGLRARPQMTLIP